MKAHDFNLPDQDGKVHSVSDFRGKWLVLYFYPKDDTPGCTKEACTFRDALFKFHELGADVVGISKDTVKSHRAFADKYHLNFTILSDMSKETIKAYGAWGEKKFMGRTFDGVLRNTYLISPEGDIVRTYEKVNPLDSAGRILADLQNLKK